MVLAPRTTIPATSRCARKFRAWKLVKLCAFPRISSFLFFKYVFCFLVFPLFSTNQANIYVFAGVRKPQPRCLEELGEEGCKGIEFNRNSKRCELWKRKEGIWAFSYPQWEGFTCLRYGWPGKFLNPVNGGLDQACRGAGGQNSAGFYVVEAVRHMEDCRARCVAAPICKGLEFSKGRCDLVASHPVPELFGLLVFSGSFHLTHQ